LFLNYPNLKQFLSGFDVAEKNASKRRVGDTAWEGTGVGGSTHPAASSNHIFYAVSIITSHPPGVKQWQVPYTSVMKSNVKGSSTAIVDDPCYLLP